MAVCSFCARISFKTMELETSKGLTLPEFERQPPKRSLVEAVEPGAIAAPYDHQPSVLELVRSSSSCSMCQLLLSLFDGTNVITQAKEHAHAGSYTKVQIMSADGDSENIKSNAALKYAQISSNDHVWSSKSFAMATDQCKSTKVY